MKLALTLACGVLSLLAPPAASADALPVQPGIHVDLAVAGGAGVGSEPSGQSDTATMEPAEAALLFAGMAGVNALVARRRCIVARLAAPVRNS